MPRVKDHLQMTGRGNATVIRRYQQHIDNGPKDVMKLYENDCLKVLTIDFRNVFTISISTCISSSISACCKFHTYSKHLHKYKTNDYPVSLLMAKHI